VTAASSGRPEFATNQPEGAQTVADAVAEMIACEAHRPELSLAIASAFFNPGGWQLLAKQLRRVGNVRLLLGAEPQRHTDPVVLRPGSVPARRAAEVALAEALSDQSAALATDRDLTAFTESTRATTADLIGWLRSGTVEVRRYTREFLHGKAYLIDNPALGVIAGSSNFTYAGLAKNRELNLGQYSQTTIDAVRHWFDELWREAESFDLASFYEQQIVPHEPWLVFLRMLWEAYGHQMNADDEAVAADPSLRDLLPFQKDGVGRARRILEKHNGVLIADEVGLGKTYVGGALIKDTVRSRRRVLIVAPKIIRDSVWKPYVDSQHLGGWVDAISYDDLLAERSSEGRRWRLDVARDPEEYSLVVLDEAHTVRNSDTNRAKALVEILKGNPRKEVVLLTATPVNNALRDLHSLMSYFIVHDDEFAEIGIPSLSAHFRAVDKLNPDDLSPEHLFDILDAVAVRRTRRFVRNHYVGQRIDESGATLVFPEPKVRRVDYELAPVIAGFFDTFAHALGADRDVDDPDLFFSGEIPTGGLCSIDSTRLTLAGYTPSRYQLVETDRRQRAAEVTVAGLLRSGLLKRFESSGYAFTSTCRKMAGTLEGLLKLIEGEGMVASGESLRDWMRVDLDDPADLNDWLATADYTTVAEFQLEALVNDIRSDITLLANMADKIESGISNGVDPKVSALTDTLVKVLAEADRDAAHRAAATLEAEPPAEESRDRDDRKVVVFSYFADTVYYLQDNIERILHDDRLAPYRGRVAFVTGSARKTPGHGVEAGSIEQAAAVAGFAPKTAGGKDAEGRLLAEDRYDLLVSSDVLSEGVNLQQAHNIINYDLPWNPMRLVQRHGRVDRIGSDHRFIYLWCFFPDVDLDRLLGLETILERKLAKASKSIGQGAVLPGIAASDDVVFNARNEQVKALAGGDATLFLDGGGALISGEEFRAMLRHAIENESLERRLEELPWGVGSGFSTDDRPPGLVFCARILNRADEPVFRFIPLTQTLLISGQETAESVSLPDDEPLAAHDTTDRTTLDGVPVDIVMDSLTALSMANPPHSDAPANLPADWLTLAYKAWATVQGHIANTWNSGLDTPTSGDSLPAVVREAVQHLLVHSTHRNRDDVDQAVRIYRRGQAARVTSIVRTVLRDDGLTDKGITDRLIELVDELGLTVPESRERRFPIRPEDVHLIAWMAIIPRAESSTTRPDVRPVILSDQNNS
jgi:hypothetical protein